MKYLDADLKNDILTALYILKCDPVERVSLEASRTWQIYVDNQPKILKATINVLIPRAIHFLGENNEELHEIGRSSLRSLVVKFGDKLVPDLLSYFEEKIEGEGTSIFVVSGVCSGLFEIVDGASLETIEPFRKRVIALVTPLFLHDTREIRQKSHDIFCSLAKTLASPTFLKDFL